MRKHRLAIVVLNWNCADDAMRCIESLLSQTICPDIILVDNNSRDDSVDRLEIFIAQHPKSTITFLKNTHNSGYSGGNNIGFQYALHNDYSLIGTLNPDAIAHPAWVENLLTELDSEADTAVATGLLLQSNRITIDSSGEQYSTWGIPSPRGRGLLKDSAPRKSEYIFASTGGGFICRASMLQDVGLFDEKFFMYFEDVDLCFRAQLRGYKIRYTPSAVAYHKTGTSSNKVPGLTITQTFKNLPLLFTKNVPFSLWVTILPRFSLAYLLIFGNALVHGRGLPATKGVLHAFLLIGHSIRERRKIQSTRRVKDSYIRSIMLHDIPLEQSGLRKFRNFFTGV